jgi:hypothetical protein
MTIEGWSSDRKSWSPGEKDRGLNVVIAAAGASG